MYALNYDTQGRFSRIFKLATNDKFNELSCEDVALIDNRIDKGRNPKAEEINSIVRAVFKEAV